MSGCSARGLGFRRFKREGKLRVFASFGQRVSCVGGFQDF